jgi:hypothetical protein
MHHFRLWDCSVSNWCAAPFLSVSCCRTRQSLPLTRRISCRNPQNTTSYFYFDQTNQRRGPVNEQQLRELATRGVIGPHTPMETDTGYEGVAGQIPGLNFNVAASSASAQTASPPFNQTASAVGVHARQATGSIFSRLFDFAFRDIRIHFVILWFCRNIVRPRMD